MPDESSLPEELAVACRALEDRLRIAKIPSYKIKPGEWEDLPADIYALVPVWLMRLLESYAVAGAFLEYRDRIQKWQRVFSFLVPGDFKIVMETGSMFRQLIPFGFVPIASEANGDMWLARLAGGPAGEIFLFMYSDWDGVSVPSEDDCLVIAATRLAVLLAFMAISKSGIDNLPCMMWRRD
jgi:hypothetical protein